MKQNDWSGEVRAMLLVYGGTGVLRVVGDEEGASSVKLKELGK